MNFSLWPLVAVLFNIIIAIFLAWVGFAFNSFSQRQKADKREIKDLITTTKDSNLRELSFLRERIAYCENDIKTLKEEQGTIEGTIRVLTVKIETLCKSIETMTKSINKITDKA